MVLTIVILLNPSGIPQPQNNQLHATDNSDAHILGGLLAYLIASLHPFPVSCFSPYCGYDAEVSVIDLFFPASL